MTSTTSTTPGMLYIVATPIGNRDDISQRALHTLKEVDAILAEDTRHSKQLLSSFGIKNQLISLHEHNEVSKSASIIEDLIQGKTFALISDAGTPLINDPGYPLVNMAHEKQIQVVPIPGPCALITALSAAGVPSDIFTFAGFLPSKPLAKRHKLKNLQSLTHTLVFYESTHRRFQSIDDIQQVFGDCDLVVAKELTKAFEHFISGTCSEVKAWFLEASPRVKGEFVVIIPPRITSKDPSEHRALLSILLSELPLKQAVKIASQITKTNKNELYQLALKITKTMN